ncbi:hypothetical protein [Reyranella sp.]|jgi:hypothetical protein|uniref:hypothetical protein n=1 Tax=Reyranella sp. TaxID=1929291 RepID=UPI002F937335
MPTDLPSIEAARAPRDRKRRNLAQKALRLLLAAAYLLGLAIAVKLLGEFLDMP